MLQMHAARTHRKLSALLVMPQKPDAEVRSNARSRCETSCYSLAPERHQRDQESTEKRYCMSKKNIQALNLK